MESAEISLGRIDLNKPNLEEPVGPEFSRAGIKLSQMGRPGWIRRLDRMGWLRWIERIMLISVSSEDAANDFCRIGRNIPGFS